MKKLFLMLAVASLSLSAVAQDDDDVNIAPAEKHRVATNGFWQNWFLGANVTWNAFYGEGQRSLVAPFRKFPSGTYYNGLGFSLSLGKWLTPVFALRTKVNAWQIGKKDEGLGGDKYWTANEQLLINATTLFRGYDEYRFWNIIPYVGAGVHRNMTHSHYSTVLSCGLLNTLRLSPRFSANIELAWNSAEGSNSGLALKNRNQHFAVEVGITWNIGKNNWRHATDQDAVTALTDGELDALNAQLADLQAENDRLQQMLEAQPAPTTNAVTVAPSIKTVDNIISAPVSIFFERGKSTVIASRDMLSVKALAELAIDKKAYVVVTGYADSKTGTAEGNQKLSERRAQAVADELVRLGVSRERIEVVGAGAVDTVSPAEYNRRAIVELK
jgi:outer membrane protein OmpA-like peptidoglycan-associated protein